MYIHCPLLEFSQYPEQRFLIFSYNICMTLLEWIGLLLIYGEILNTCVCMYVYVYCTYDCRKDQTLQLLQSELRAAPKQDYVDK